MTTIRVGQAARTKKETKNLTIVAKYWKEKKKKKRKPNNPIKKLHRHCK